MTGRVAVNDQRPLHAKHRRHGLSHERLQVPLLDEDQPLLAPALEVLEDLEALAEPGGPPYPGLASGDRGQVVRSRVPGIERDAAKVLDDFEHRAARSLPATVQ